MHLSLIILQSLDGFIAKHQSDDLSWGSYEDKQFFRNKTKEIGTMILGSNTFKNMPIKAFEGRVAVVMTTDPEQYQHKNYPENIIFTTQKPEGVIELIKKMDINHVAVIGGGHINQLFLHTGLIDEIFITIAGYVFFDGIPSFGPKVSYQALNLQLLDVHKITQNEILLHYKVRK
jgi:dihydrofolate reductase